MIKDKVISAIAQACNNTAIQVLTPKQTQFGDYAIHIKNVECITENKKNKEEIIQKLISKLSDSELFGKVEQRDEYINFFIKKKLLIEELHLILQQQDNYGKVIKSKPVVVNVEYGQPNTHKLPHIGHLFSYIYGESLARLFENSGDKVIRCNYQGDIGLHVAKCLYIVKRQKAEVKNLINLEEKVKFLQKCYQQGSQLYQKDAGFKKNIDKTNQQIYNNHPEMRLLWQETRQWCLQYYSKFEEQLGIQYNKHYFESETGPKGVEIVKSLTRKVFENSQGAIVFRGEKYGFHTRVFVTKDGYPTYETKDIGLVRMKYNDWHFDRAIIATASEQDAYWQVVKKAIELCFPDLKDKIIHLGFGMIDLKQGKMSSRTGNIISAIDLIETIRYKAFNLINKDFIRTFEDNGTIVKTNKESSKKGPVIGYGEATNITEIVSDAAIKYAFLKSEAKKNISFDIDESISLSGNSGPYILYTYARCMSVLKKKADKQAVLKNKNLYTPNSDELLLLRLIFKYPEVISNAVSNYSPHFICNYVYDVCQRFSYFYEKNPIIKSESTTKDFRLALTTATAQIIKNSLYLLGIKTADKL